MFDQQLDTNGDGVLTLLEVAAHVSQLSDDADEGMQVADVVAAVAAEAEAEAPPWKSEATGASTPPTTPPPPSAAVAAAAAPDAADDDDEEAAAVAAAAESEDDEEATEATASAAPDTADAAVADTLPATLETRPHAAAAASDSHRGVSAAGDTS